MEEQVTISVSEYKELLQKAEFLEALEDNGVDNWDGYSDAYKSVYEND